MQTKSKVLLAIQFTLLAYLLLTTHPIHRLWLGAAFCCAAFLLLVWAIVAMSKSRIRIAPEPAHDATLVTSGPYRFIRHPMYAALIIGSAGLLIIAPSTMRIVATCALVVVLVLKLRLEENMLSHQFPGYRAYMRRTYRLVPFLY